MSAEGKIGAALGLIAFVGAGAAVVYPTEAVGWITIAFGLWGLALLGVHHYWERFTSVAAAFAFVGFVLTSVFIAATVKPRPAPSLPTEIAKKPDPKAFCFAGFKISYKNKEIGVVALLANSNKEPVQFIYMGGDVTLNGFPPALQVAGQHQTLQPEQHLASLESKPVKLGRHLPAGTELEGTVDFQARYGPTETETVLARVHGKLFLMLEPKGPNTVGIDQEIAPDSLAWCDKQTVDYYANQRM